jgi:hypothetical protein
MITITGRWLEKQGELAQAPPVGASGYNFDAFFGSLEIGFYFRLPIEEDSFHGF